MRSIHPVQHALRHVVESHPEVTKVVFGHDGSWDYQTPEGNSPPLGSEIDHRILAAAGLAAHKEKGWPCTYDLMTLQRLYQLWDQLADVPVNDDGMETLGEAFEQFPKGTMKEAVWRWFEAQHPDFVVGEVMAGVRRTSHPAMYDAAEVLEELTLADGWTLWYRTPHVTVAKSIDTVVGPKEAIVCWAPRRGLPPHIWAQYDSEGGNVLATVQPFFTGRESVEQVRAEVLAMLRRIAAEIDQSYARRLWLMNGA